MLVTFLDDLLRECLPFKLTEGVIVSNGNGFLKFDDITVDSLNKHAQWKMMYARGE